MTRLDFWSLAALLVSLELFAGVAPTIAGDRVALVIGNGLYQKVPALPNPTRDAADIGHALERLNFKVTQLSNAGASDMRKAIVDFGRAAEGSEMAIVYYAGHGMEAGGENWLVPIDAELRSDTDVESEAVSLRSVNLQVSKARQLGLIILDACRNNPFAAKMQRSLRTRAVARGLAPTEPTDNVLVAYAARDGTTANDGDGRNSPFTAALLHNIETPGLEISFLFRNVRDEVMKATKREQQPFVYGSLSKEAIYLKPLAASTTAKTSPQADIPASTEDEQFWQAIKTSSVTGLYEEFLKRYPRSARVSEARERFDYLRSKQLASVAPAATAPMATDLSKEPLQEPQSSRNATLDERKSRNVFTAQDARRVAALGAKLQLKMPPFVIGETKSDVSNSYRQFVGIWSSRIGFGGQGRHAMLIVTEVLSDGLALGYCVWGPSTQFSWETIPAGHVSFAERILDGTLSVKLNKSIWAAKLTDHNSMTLRSTYLRSDKTASTASIDLSPVWQLVAQDRSLTSNH